MLGAIALFLGCVGQALFWPVPPWATGRYTQTALFLLPWLVTFVMNLTNVSPVSAPNHLRICAGAMFWWALLTLTTEGLYVTGVLTMESGARVVIAHALMHLGWLGFVPVYVMKKRLRSSGTFSG